MPFIPDMVSVGTVTVVVTVAGYTMILGGTEIRMMIVAETKNRMTMVAEAENRMTIVAETEEAGAEAEAEVVNIRSTEIPLDKMGILCDVMIATAPNILLITAQTEGSRKPT